MAVSYNQFCKYCILDTTQPQVLHSSMTIYGNVYLLCPSPGRSSLNDFTHRSKITVVLRLHCHCHSQVGTKSPKEDSALCCIPS
ncbi:hypothetical protein T4C_8500 [Trichinella pseudospiralis]|uniref:Uncharacterized protein n=1 Tax=Trichinella pseudospiralis TaxID=6337 RepID=A0A0V1JZI3_TRIPS|nr:hypothetical protein T4C_8500 [Trichinella pseudospiralis]